MEIGKMVNFFGLKDIKMEKILILLLFHKKKDQRIIFMLIVMVYYNLDKNNLIQNKFNGY